jgi:hypothetical protein
MQWFLRVVCIGYVVFLTLLLLTADPARVIGVRGDLPWLLRKLLPEAHSIGFLVLAVLALAPRWPLPRWCIVLLLAIYGGMTEIVQGFVPSRTPEWLDWFQDLGGIAAGAAFCWLVAMLLNRWMRRRTRLTTGGADDWAVLRKIVLDPAPDDKS